jgi:hypothetical protein
MQAEARFRRRAESGEVISELNILLLEKLSKIKGFWKASASAFGAYFDAGGGESAASDISPCLIDAINGAISYASRLPVAISDKAISDDFMVLKFDCHEIDFYEFCHDVFPEIIKAFRPYRAVVVTNLEQDLDDFEDIVEESYRTGKDIDGRDSIFRIQSVNYFDDTLCRRAFGISSSGVVEILKESVERAELISGGAFLVISCDPASGKDLASIDKSIRERLNGKL